ncbi:MAG: hypothetical protein U0326_34225 [Polyangiales bacterium]
MARERERERKSWREIDRSRSQSYHADEVRKAGGDVTPKPSAAVKEYKAALEALFQKKPEAAEKIEKMLPTVALPRVVEAAADDVEARAAQKRQDLLRKINAAQNPKAISDTIDTFLHSGFTLPDDQEVMLQMLEHRDEERVREALSKLDFLLMGQLPKRKPVLVQRLKRLEEHAEEDSTRTAAGTLRRKVA